MKMSIGFHYIGMVDDVTDFKLSDELVYHIVLFNGRFKNLFQSTNKICLLMLAEINIPELS